MLDSPAGLIATAVLVLAIATSIGIVLYAISIVMRANQPIPQTPEELIETLKEAINTLGRTCEIMTNAIRNMAPNGPNLLGPDKVASAPQKDVMEKILVILNTPAKERTDENYAFLERYATSTMLRTLMNAGDTNPDVIQNFALERRTYPETRTHLLKALHQALTEDTDSFPVVPNDSDLSSKQVRAQGRSTVAPSPNQGRVVAVGQVVVGVSANGQPAQSSPQ